MQKTLTIISFIFIVFAALMIISYSMHRHVIGGDAFSGYIEDGKYYIWVEGETYKEVPKQTWYINKSLFISMLIVGFLAICGLAYLGVVYYLPFILKHIK